MYADVLVEIKAKNIDQTFTYKIPDNIKNKIQKGVRVIVPFGNQSLEGFVLNIKNTLESNYNLKEIISLIDEQPVLNEELLELGKYISKKTLCNLISAYQTMLPSALKAKIKDKTNKKLVSYIELNNSDIKVTNQKQQEIINLIIKDKTVLKSICQQISSSSLQTLLKNNIVKEIKKEQYRLIENTPKLDTKINFTEEQIQTINTISNTVGFVPFLIHGVTGSGKTAIYIELIDKVLKQNKEAILLVPEISLTPQVVNKFKEKFGTNVAILHSSLSNGEKYDEWRKIERQEVKIVIGARSAIFAPFKNLGIIIIDEEHSTTYKQENTPKYHAIDIAIFRSKKNQAKLILGSATPSIESYTRAKTGIYKLCTIKNRINQTFPYVTLIDMKNEIKKGNRIISNLLEKKINEKLEKNEQIIILLNRRGFTTVTTCKTCGFTHKCPNCDIPFTYHKGFNKMVCHYCGHQVNVITSCPNCKSKEINSLGMGTEKLELVLKEQFQNAKIIRMDNDTTTKKGSHKKIIDAFNKKEYNILLGTQMIAKGLDFPDVTLVGVISGDSSLNIPDFRSAERTFQLLTQVAGRAGRAKLKGEVIIQGFNIDNYSIECASRHDYERFYNQELEIRKKLKYSPYYNLCLIKIKSKDIKEINQESNKIIINLKNKINNKAIILGPALASIPKINQIYTSQIIIKYKKIEDIINELQFIIEMYRKHKVNVEIDLNPIQI